MFRSLSLLCYHTSLYGYTLRRTQTEKLVEFFEMRVLHLKSLSVFPTHRTVTAEFCVVQELLSRWAFRILQVQ